jgi:hypothetical protein
MSTLRCRVSYQIRRVFVPDKHYWRGGLIGTWNSDVQPRKLDPAEIDPRFPFSVFGRVKKVAP